jgi:hypothetical protein
MSIDEGVVFGLVLPLVAVALSFFAKSKAAFLILRYGGGYFFVAFSISWVLNYDCGFPPFHFGTCQTLPQFLADFYSIPHMINVGALFFIAPVLLLLVTFFEFRTRAKRQ